jgi:hypothetical protein
MKSPGYTAWIRNLIRKELLKERKEFERGQ